MALEKEDLVGRWMTPDPIVIAPQTTLPEAYQLMKAAGIRRLLVVERGELIGVVTLEDIRTASPVNPAAMSIYELNYELANLTVNKIMSPAPITVSIDETIYAAAHLMIKHGISGLPVLKGNSIQGIITESDIFRVFAQAEE